MKKYIICILATLAIGMGYLLSHSEILMLAEYTNPVAMRPETFSDLMQQPMGLLAWAGCWIAQLFHIPALGALAMSALWAAIAALLIKGWQLENHSAAIATMPATALLWSIGCLGYWMHYSNLTGYYASHSLAALIIATMLCISLKSKTIAIISPIILYPVMGCWNLVMGLAISVPRIRKEGIRALMPAAIAAAVPAAWYALCYNKFLPASEIYTAGLPMFDCNGYEKLWLLIPLHICALCLACGVLVKSLRRANLLAPGMALALILAAMAGSRHSSFFYNEIRMQNAALCANWQQIIETGDQSKELTETMKVLYEVAMNQTNTLGSHAFETHHTMVTNPEAQAAKVNAMHMAAPIAHYYYGRYNISTRWCLEVGLKYGLGTGPLRLLAMSALANGEPQAAAKYLSIIRKSLFMKEWQIPGPSQATRDFHQGISNRLETDHDCDEYLEYLATQPDNIHTQTAAQWGMYYAMLGRNRTVFRETLYADSLKSRPLQRHYQEAALMMLDSIPPNMVDHEVETGFADFNQMVQQLQASQNKDLVMPIYQKYGHTYWWYAIFEK